MSVLTLLLEPHFLSSREGFSHYLNPLKKIKNQENENENKEEESEEEENPAQLN